MAERSCENFASEITFKVGAALHAIVLFRGPRSLPTLRPNRSGDFPLISSQPRFRRRQRHCLQLV